MANIVDGIMGVAEAFDCSPQAIRNWRCPLVAGTGPNDTDAIYEWLRVHRPRNKARKNYERKRKPQATSEQPSAELPENVRELLVRAEAAGLSIRELMDLEQCRISAAKADREEIARDKDRGILVPKEEVEQEVQRLGAGIRIKLMAIPRAMAERCLACDTPHEVETLLTDAIRDALVQLSGDDGLA